MKSVKPPISIELDERDRAILFAILDNYDVNDLPARAAVAEADTDEREVGTYSLQTWIEDTLTHLKR